MATVPRRVYHLNGDTLIMDHTQGAVTTVKAPADTYDGGLAGLLGRINDVSDPQHGAVVLLDGPTVTALGLTPDTIGAVDGWKIRGMAGWYTAGREGTNRGTSLRVGIIPWMNADQSLMHANWPGDTVARYARWHDLIGHSYTGTPGFALSTAFMREWTGSGARPTWIIKGAPLDDWRASEAAYTGWRTPSWTGGPVIGYDRIRAGLATLSSVEVYPYTPARHQPVGILGKLPFDRTRGGMWLVTAEPWNDERMPDPLNRAPHELPTDETPYPRFWRSTPTLALAEDLTNGGKFGGFEVHECWTGSAKRLFRPFAERIRDAWEASYLTWPWSDSAEGVAIRDVLKLGYPSLVGLWNRPSQGGTFRPDWYAAHTGLANATAWRWAYKAGMAGHWPVAIEGDCAYYAPGDTPDGYPCETIGDRSTNRLGNYRVVEAEL